VLAAGGIAQGPLLLLVLAVLVDQVDAIIHVIQFPWDDLDGVVAECLLQDAYVF
jgi:hypothetical protein